MRFGESEYIFVNAKEDGEGDEHGEDVASGQALLDRALYLVDVLAARLSRHHRIALYNPPFFDFPSAKKQRSQNFRSVNVDEILESSMPPFGTMSHKGTRQRK